MTSAWVRYWYDAPVSRQRLAALRVVLFGLLAIDLWALMISRAYRLGAMGFNISHVPALDRWLPLPTPSIYVVAYLLAGFLAAGVAFGLRARWALPVLATSYAATYFWSQQDGYQHHYLLALLLGIACFVPWHHAPPGPPVRSWAVRLLYVQIAIVYFFGGVAKVHPHWLDGWALDMQLGNPTVTRAIEAFGESVGMGPTAPYAAAAWLVMLWEFFVAAAFLTPRLRLAACITGPLFHASVELLGYEIRFFSYYMFALYYVLLFPDAWFEAVARPFTRAAAAIGRLAARLAPPGPRAVAVGTGVVVCGLAGASQPYPAAGWVGVAFAGVVALRELTAERRAPSDAWRRTGAQIAAVTVMVLLTRPGGAAYDYWRLDGGDRQRRGDTEGAIAAYERAVAVANVTPSRETELADLYVQAGRYADAEAMYVRAVAADPEDEYAREGLDRIRRRLERQRLEEGTRAP